MRLVFGTILVLAGIAGTALLTQMRDRILFVGGFRHPPNVDAVQWLVEDILPLIRATQRGLFRRNASACQGG